MSEDATERAKPAASDRETAMRFLERLEAHGAMQAGGIIPCYVPIDKLARLIKRARRKGEMAERAKPAASDLERAEQIVSSPWTDCIREAIEPGDPSLLADKIAAALTEARRESEIAMRERAAQAAEADSGVSDCPYTKDNPGDPTWNHTEADRCPACGQTGIMDAVRSKCWGVAKHRIARRVRALEPS